MLILDGLLDAHGDSGSSGAGGGSGGAAWIQVGKNIAYRCCIGPPHSTTIHHFQLENCIIMRANTSFYNPVQKDYDNSVSVCNNMRLFET